ncbi:hypothetical protein C1E24_01455 [Pseudoalteromonas phenolica]|uniref:Uncharacterized protein n=1 Tax=Pseudoalteromonas phenolica TaxID=161398 RepID=A0A5R9Q8Q3_9GAMM|nr:transporter substrate-binding domain-containing protein [Pseudoalteromonas phenolica]TLX48799.1 hypothetical protein C1E24_01455 [Pseudoalteromonas phenolica]
MFYWILIVISCILTVKSFASVHKVDVIAIDYPPFISQSEPSHGITYELLERKLANLKLIKLRPRFLPPARAQTELTKSGWCLSFYPPAPSEFIERIPLSEDKVLLGFISKQQQVTWQNFKYFKQKRLAMLRATITEGMQGQLKQAGAVIVSVETVDQGINLLLKGRVDFAFTDNLSFLEKQKTNKEYAQLAFAKTPLIEVQVGVYFNTQCKYAGLLAPHLRKLEIKN